MKLENIARENSSECWDIEEQDLLVEDRTKTDPLYYLKDICNKIGFYTEKRKQVGLYQCKICNKIEDEYGMPAHFIAYFRDHIHRLREKKATKLEIDYLNHPLR